MYPRTVEALYYQVQHTWVIYTSVCVSWIKSNYLQYPQNFREEIGVCTKLLKHETVCAVAEWMWSKYAGGFLPLPDACPLFTLFSYQLPMCVKEKVALWMKMGWQACAWVCVCMVGSCKWKWVSMCVWVCGLPELLIHTVCGRSCKRVISESYKPSPYFDLEMN